MLTILKRTIGEFAADDCMRMAAAISYYAIFSLPPLLLLLLTITGVSVDSAQVEARIQSEVSAVAGADAARQVAQMVRNASRTDASGPAALLSVAALLFGATAAFGALQGALNRAWEVEPDPDRGGVWNFLLKRLLSLVMVGGIALLLLLFLLLTAAVNAFGGLVPDIVPGGVSQALLQALELGVSVGVITLLFALMFKVLPDARIEWRHVWIGAFGTACLFVAGKFLIGIYLSHASPGAAFGAARSLALLLVWIYYSSMILLLGAEFTQVWAAEHGEGIRPSAGAVRAKVEIPDAPGA